MILEIGAFHRDPGKSRFTAKIMSAKNDKATSASICGIARDRGIQKSWYFKGLGISKIFGISKRLGIVKTLGFQGVRGLPKGLASQ